IRPAHDRIAASWVPDVTTRVSSIAQLSINGRPAPANVSSDRVGNGSSNRRYVLTKSSGRPSADSSVLTASTRAGWVNTAGFTHAPSRAPDGGGATGPAWKGPVRVAIPALPLGLGATAGGRVVGRQVTRTS